MNQLRSDPKIDFKEGQVHLKEALKDWDKYFRSIKVIPQPSTPMMELSVVRIEELDP